MRHASRLICGGLVGLVDLGPHDLERALALYVDCRAALPNLDGVLAMLVQCVARLAMRAHSMARARLGHSNRKTAALVKACLAYCHITIPSLSGTTQPESQRSSTDRPLAGWRLTDTHTGGGWWWVLW